MTAPLDHITEHVVDSGDFAYFLLDVNRQEVHSAQLCHHDATTAGAWTVYSSNRSDAPIPESNDAVSVPDLEYWSLESAPAPTAPAGSAAGSYMLHLSGSGAMKYLIRFVASAASLVSVHPHHKG